VGNQEIISKFAKWLKALREKHGLTQEELAQRANLEYKHIQRLESKRPCDVKLSTIHKLAQGLGTSPSKLLEIN